MVVDLATVAQPRHRCARWRNEDGGKNMETCGERCKESWGNTESLYNIYFLRNIFFDVGKTMSFLHILPWLGMIKKLVYTTTNQKMVSYLFTFGTLVSLSRWTAQPGCCEIRGMMMSFLPPMTGNISPIYGDDRGIVYYCFTHIIYIIIINDNDW